MALTQEQLDNLVTLLHSDNIEDQNAAKVLIESVCHSADDLRTLLRSLNPFEYLLHGLHGVLKSTEQVWWVIGRLAVLKDPEIQQMTHLKIDDSLGIIPEWIGALHNLQTLDVTGITITLSCVRHLATLPNLKKIMGATSIAWEVWDDLTDKEAKEFIDLLFGKDSSTISLSDIEDGDGDHLTILSKVLQWNDQIGNTVMELDFEEGYEDEMDKILPFAPNVHTVRCFGEFKEVEKLCSIITNMNVNHLVCKNSKLSILPDSLCNLSSIEELTIEPHTVTEYDQLLRWEKAETGLESVPKQFGVLSNLKILSLARNPLTSLPKSFANLTGLTHLDLSDNRLTSLPLSLDMLNSLQSIKLGKTANYLSTKWLESLGELTKPFLDALLEKDTSQAVSVSDIKTVFESDNLNCVWAMSAIAGWNKDLASQITDLDIEDNREDWNEQSHHVVPENFGNLSHLEKLELGGLNLSTLPDSMNRLTDLTELNLDNFDNTFSILPEVIGSLTSLTDLRIGGEQMTGLPNSIAHLTNLINFELGDCALQDVPASINNLTQLEYFYIGGAEDPEALEPKLISLLPNCSIEY